MTPKELPMEAPSKPKGSPKRTPNGRPRDAPRTPKGSPEEAPITDLLKPKYTPKNPRMGDCVQKKGFGQGLNLIYVSSVCLGGNLNKKSVILFAMEKVMTICHFGYIVFLSCMICVFCGIKWPINLDYFLCKTNPFLFKLSPRNIADTYIKFKPLPKPFF